MLRGGPPRVTLSRGCYLSEINISDSDEQKRRHFFQEKIGVDTGHRQLPPRVTPTLVTPLL